jgi:Skp family chaperone for outer membrane proteins
MKITRTTACVLAMLSIGLIIASTQSPLTAQQAGGPTKVAVANPGKIFGSLEETKVLNASLQNEIKNYEAQQLRRKTDIDDLRTKIGMIKPDAPQFNQMRQDLMAKQIEMKNWVELQQLEINQRLKVQTQSLYEKIAAAVAKVATEQGVHIVISDHTPEFKVDDVDINTLKALLAQRNLLYFAPTNDLSDLVIAQMDQAYKSGAR